MRKLAAVLVPLLRMCIPSYAWGPEGHRIVAEVAEHHLSAAARREIEDLLGNDDLAAISNWADETREQRPDTAGWHFVNIPWNAEGFSQTRDCFHPDPSHAASLVDHHNCVVDRIEIYETTLGNRRAPREERVEALKFLVHFVADLHQPLHAVGETRGGNDIHISAFGETRCGGRACNLHLLWDEGMIDHTRLSEVDYAAELEKFITRSNLQTVPPGIPAQWANESFRLAHQAWLRDGDTATEDYYRRNRNNLDRRLAFAGFRLAVLLNRALWD